MNAVGSLGDSDRINRPLTIFTEVFFFFERLRPSKLVCLRFLRLFEPALLTDFDGFRSSFCLVSASILNGEILILLIDTREASLDT